MLTNVLRLACATLPRLMVRFRVAAVLVPALVADKTNPRPDQAWRIRKLGRGFHAMAEIHWSTWQTWMQNNGKTWFEAGVEARRPVAAGGHAVRGGGTSAGEEVSA